MSRTHFVLNLLAALLGTPAAVAVAGRVSPLYVAALAWLPVLAFSMALLANTLRAPAFLRTLAAAVNAASVLLVCAVAAVASTETAATTVLVPLFAAATSLAGWNFVALTSPPVEG